MSRRSRRRQPNRTATRREQPTRPGRPDQDLGPEAQPLVQEIRSALRDEDRLQIIRLMSSLVEVFDAAGGDPGPPISLVEFTDTFLDVDIAETTAALHVLAALTDDEVLASRIRRTVSSRRQPVPDHVKDLDRVAVDSAAYLGDELGDGENILLSVRWPTGPGATVVVYIDHATGSRVKDAMIIDEPVEEMVDRFRRLMDEDGRSGGVLETLAVADARATIDSALESGEANDLVDPSDDEEADEDWPMPRPIVQMLLRRMPSGGSAVGRIVSLEDVTVAEVLRGFLDSPEARGLDTGPHSTAVEMTRVLVWYAATYSGHPLRWSPRTLEVALTEVLPFDPGVADPVLDEIAEVLPRLVEYSLRRLGISEDRIKDTLMMLPDLLDHFDDLRDPGDLGGLGDMESVLTALLSGDHGAIYRRLLVEQVGSEEALEALTDEALPEEDLDLSQLPEDVRAPVAEIGSWIDRWLDESEDARQVGDEAEELRTACRRFLSTTAVGDPQVFRRRARADLSALAVLWTVGRVNGLIGYSPAPVRTGDLQGWFGAGSLPSGRAQTMTVAFGGDVGSFQPALGDPQVLTGRQRAELIDRRDAREK